MAAEESVKPVGALASRTNSIAQMCSCGEECVNCDNTQFGDDEDNSTSSEEEDDL